LFNNKKVVVIPFQTLDSFPRQTVDLMPRYPLARSIRCCRVSVSDDCVASSAPFYR